MSSVPCKLCGTDLPVPTGPGRPPQYHEECRGDARRKYWEGRRKERKLERARNAKHEAAIRNLFEAVHITDDGRLDWAPLVTLLAKPEGRFASRDVVAWALNVAWEQQQFSDDPEEAKRFSDYRVAAKRLLEALP